MLLSKWWGRTGVIANPFSDTFTLFAAQKSIAFLRVGLLLAERLAQRRFKLIARRQVLHQMIKNDCGEMSIAH